MAQKTKTDYSVIENATVKEVRKNQYDTYELIAETISPLTGVPVEQRIRLYTTDFNTHEVSDDVIKNTQSQLREALHDDTITFREVPDESDPTDIVSWAKAHAGETIEKLYVVNGRPRLTAPRENQNGNADRRAFWLRKYRPEMGEYNPDEHFVSFYDAQTEEDQKAIDEANPKNSKVAESNYRGRKSTTFFNEGVIQNVMYTSAGAFKNNKPVPTKDMTAVEMIDYMVAVLTQDAPEVIVPKADQDADKEVAKKLEALKENNQNGLYAIYSVLGGVQYLNNVSEGRRESIKSFIASVSINVVSFYIRTKANKVFQLSWRSTRHIDTSRPTIHGFHIEFLKADFKSNDILLPLVDGGVVDENEALAIAKKHGWFDETQQVVKLDDMTQGMDFLRAIFNDKVLKYRSTIADERGKTEIRLLGTNFVRIVDNPETNAETNEKTQPAKETADTNVDENPFASTGSDVPNVSNDVPTPSDKSDDMGVNPFGI